MAKKTFELGNAIADALGKVSLSDHAPEQIEMIALDNIRADDRNFYSLDGIEELAANIELVGLLDPLRVRPDPDTEDQFVIVSGHRRRAALALLAAENAEKWASVPCIREEPAASPELQELRLIYANADSRKMTGPDIAAQAKRVEELIGKLATEQGVKFPGRMRDRVAEICKVNATKLAELKVIDEKLTNPVIRKYWKNGELNQAQAYAIAKAEPYVQSALCTYVGADRLPDCSAWLIESKIKKIETICERKCKHGGEHSDYCFNSSSMLERVFRNPNAYAACEYHCCGDCPEIANCKSVCGFYIEEAQKRRADKKTARAAEIKAEKDREAELIGVTRKIWKRFGELRKEKGLSAEDCTKARGDSWIRSYHGEDWHEEMEGPKAKITQHTAVPWTNSMQADDVERLVKTAELFGVSCDYLLGRTDEQRPWRGEWISVDDRYPNEGDYCLAMTHSGTVLPSVYFRAAFMDFTEKSVANERLKRVEWWMPLPAPPEGAKYTGQEIIESLTGKEAR